MPKKPTTTKEALIEGGFRLVREQGHEALTARSLAAYLGCSTQPVMYHFAMMKDLKRAVYSYADRFHTDYLMHSSGECDPLLEIGLNYIRFAIKEPHLFRFLFQSGYAKEHDLLEMIDSEELTPVLSAMQEDIGLDMEKTREVFLTVALFAHGYASIISNNALEFAEHLVAVHLERAFNGAVLAVSQEDDHEKAL